MAKKSSKSDRQAVIDEIRKKQKGAEKKRGYAIVGVCALIALLIVAAAAYRPVKNWWDLRKFEDLNLAVDRRPCVGVRRGRRPSRPTAAAEHVPAPRRSPTPPPRRRSARTGTSRASRARAVQPEVLHREGPPRARAAGPQPRARLHDPLVRRDDRRRRRRRSNMIDGIADKFRPTATTCGSSSSPRRGPRLTRRRAASSPTGCTSPSRTGRPAAPARPTPPSRSAPSSTAAEPSGEALKDFMLEYPYTDSPEPDAP